MGMTWEQIEAMSDRYEVACVLTARRPLIKNELLEKAVGACTWQIWQAKKKQFFYQPQTPEERAAALNVIPAKKPVLNIRLAK